VEAFGPHHRSEPLNLPAARPGGAKCQLWIVLRHLDVGQVAGEDFTRSGRRYDVVFDLVENRSLTELRRALTPAGTLALSDGGVSRGGRLIGPVALMVRAQVLSRFVRYRLLILAVSPSKENLAALRELAESGKLTPAIDRTYPLSEVPEGIRYMEVEHARAKVVITV
jgi:NADPH:quinone reductase-like Zn-dependent oxidoreductase